MIKRYEIGTRRKKASAVDPDRATAKARPFSAAELTRE
jgi:hypothetical protein